MHLLAILSLLIPGLFGLLLLYPCFRITLGNQLDGIHLLDPDVVARFKQRYPDGIISKPKNL